MFWFLWDSLFIFFRKNRGRWVVWLGLVVGLGGWVLGVEYRVVRNGGRVKSFRFFFSFSVFLGIRFQLFSFFFSDFFVSKTKTSPKLNAKSSHDPKFENLSLKTFEIIL